MKLPLLFLIAVIQFATIQVHASYHELLAPVKEGSINTSESTVFMGIENRLDQLSEKTKTAKKRNVTVLGILPGMQTATATVEEALLQIKPKYEHLTALHQAIQKGNLVDVVNLLKTFLEEYATDIENDQLKIREQEKKNNKQDPTYKIRSLSECLILARERVLNALLKRKNKLGYSAWDYATISSNPDIIDLLTSFDISNYIAA